MTVEYATYPSLRGRRVLVTGGASGIGASIVAHFALQGSAVGFLDLDAEAARALVARLGAGATVAFRHVDLRDIAALRHAISELEVELGGAFLVLVNNGRARRSAQHRRGHPGALGRPDEHQSSPPVLLRAGRQGRG